MSRRLLAPLAALCLGGAAGCVDLKETPITGITNTFYNTASGFESAVNAMYTPMRSWWALERGSTLTVFGTDEFTRGADGGYKFFNDYNAQLNPDVDFIRDTWRDFYQGVNTANTVIEVAKTTNVSEAQRALRTGEARFMRALYLFTLARTYGDIPMPLTPSEGPVTDTKQVPIAAVYTQIIADLLAAEQALPDKAAQFGRADKPAAQHLLAEVYLTRAGGAATSPDFALAAAKARAVVDNPRFGLLPQYKDNFDLGQEGNKEVVFAIQYTADPLSTGDGNKLHLYFTAAYDLEPGMLRDIANDRPFRRFRPTTWLLNLWDRTKDARYEQMFKVVWISNNPNNIPKDAAGAPKYKVGDTAVYMPGVEVTAAQRAATRYKIYAPSDYTQAMFPTLNKFLDPTRTSTNEERGQRDHPIMRLANTYLMLAEALMRDGKPAEALPYVNAIRVRAAKPGQTEAMKVTAADLSLDFILDERARELTGETTRWFDLKRSGKLIERVKKYNPEAAAGISETYLLRPIPTNEILLSTGGIKQNPGY
ncbi:MAG: RagB/SusD family nutrient uptake outer membrane protein [Gemmatimonadaceae bacterium]